MCPPYHFQIKETSTGTHCCKMTIRFFNWTGCLTCALAWFEISIRHFWQKVTIFKMPGVVGTFVPKRAVVKGLTSTAARYKTQLCFWFFIHVDYHESAHAAFDFTKNKVVFFPPSKPLTYSVAERGVTCKSSLCSMKTLGSFVNIVILNRNAQML